MEFNYILIGILVFLLIIAIYDLIQNKHTVTRNFPIIGHLRFLLEKVGPEIRQYLITDNDSER